MEKKLTAPVDKVFGLLTDPKWLEARCLAMGELSANCKTKKTAGAATVTMKRRVRRELNAIISKVLNPESDIELVEQWSVDKDSRSWMNLTMRLPNEDLEKKRISEAKANGFIGLKGHRSVGGIRVSLYNAMTLDGASQLADFMEAFKKAN